MPSHDLPANRQELQNSDQSSSLVRRCGNRISDFQAWRFVPGVMCRPLGCDYLWCCWRAIRLSFEQHRPGHARHLVGQRHGRHLRAESATPSCEPPLHRHRAQRNHDGIGFRTRSSFTETSRKLRRQGSDGLNWYMKSSRLAPLGVFPWTSHSI